MDKTQLVTKLKKFGLEERQIQIYTNLLKNGVQTPLQLSRSTKITRPTIYRDLEDLEQIGLVERILDQKSTKFKAAKPENLETIINNKEIELKTLKDTLPETIRILNDIRNVHKSKTEVRYYSGITGLKQLLWNLTKSKEKELVSYGYLSWNEGVGFKYAEKLRREFAAKKVKSREISNTKESEEPWTDQIELVKKYYQERYISPDILEIKNDIYIYDNIVAYYNIMDNDYFGLEIENKNITKTQKQLFEIVWEMGEEMKIGG